MYTREPPSRLDVWAGRFRGGHHQPRRPWRTPLRRRFVHVFYRFRDPNIPCTHDNVPIVTRNLGVATLNPIEECSDQATPTPILMAI